MRPAEWYRERASALLSEADRKTVRDDWLELTGRPFSGSFNRHCPNCYSDAIHLILRAMNKKSKCPYILRGGVVIRYRGDLYTRLNLTAPVARWFLRQDAKNRDLFEVIPQDPKTEK